MSATETRIWPTVRLGDIGQSIIGLTYSPSDVSQSGTLVLRSSNIQDGRLTFDDNVYVRTPIPEKIRVREGDILICVRNGSRRLIGKSVVLDWRVVDQTFGAFMAVYRSRSNTYLQFFLQSDEFKRQVDEHLGATINQITNASLNNFVVALPTPVEQEAIASRLADTNRHIATLERLIAKKEAIRQGMMQQLLTGRTRLSGWHSNWVPRRLESVLNKLEAGVSVNSVSDPGAYSVLKTSCVSAGEFDPSERKTVAPSDIKRVKASPRADSLIISRMNTPALVGEVGYVGADYPTLFLPDRLWLATKRNAQFVDMRWLAYMLSSTQYREQLREIATGTSGSMKNIARSTFLKLSVPFPPIEEQIAIAGVMNDADDEIAALRARLDKARAMKAGMMQQLLTGRTRLPVQEAAA